MVKINKYTSPCINIVKIMDNIVMFEHSTTSRQNLLKQHNGFAHILCIMQLKGIIIQLEILDIIKQMCVELGKVTFSFIMIIYMKGAVGQVNI